MNQQIATFLVGDTILGIDILFIKEVHRQLRTSPVPGAPREITGLVNLRGKIVTIIDLEYYLTGKSRESLENTRLLIMKTGAELQALHQDDEEIANARVGDDIVGLLIKRMDEVITIDSDEILSPPSNMSEVESGIIEGVVKLEDRLVLILDHPAVLNRALTAAE